MVADETVNDRSKQAGLPAYFLLAFGIAWSSILLIASATGLPARPGTPETNRYLMFLGMLAVPIFYDTANTEF